MLTREYAVNVFNKLDENELLDFLKLFADDNTLALVESEIIANTPNRKHYNSIWKIVDEINEENYE